MKKIFFILLVFFSLTACNFLEDIDYTMDDVLAVGDVVRLKTNALDPEYVIWTTSDEAIATVSSLGIVSAKAIGDVTISAKYQNKIVLYNLTIQEKVNPYITISGKQSIKG